MSTVLIDTEKTVAETLTQERYTKEQLSRFLKKVGRRKICLAFTDGDVPLFFALSKSAFAGDIKRNNLSFEADWNYSTVYVENFKKEPK